MIAPCGKDNDPLHQDPRYSHRKQRAGAVGPVILPGRCTNFFSPLSCSRSPAAWSRDTISFYLLDPLHDPRLLWSPSPRPPRPVYRGLVGPGATQIEHASRGALKGILGQAASEYGWIGAVSTSLVPAAHPHIEFLRILDWHVKRTVSETRFEHGNEK